MIKTYEIIAKLVEIELDAIVVKAKVDLGLETLWSSCCGYIELLSLAQVGYLYQESGDENGWPIISKFLDELEQSFPGSEAAFDLGMSEAIESQMVRGI